MNETAKPRYYSISEVSEKLDLAPHVLRYWESEFSELQPKKNRAGNRIYTQKDIDLLDRIRFLLRESKFTLEGAKQVLKRQKQSNVPVRELMELRAFLVELLQKL